MFSLSLICYASFCLVMEKNNEQNEIYEENPNFCFPFEDANMLEKLRSCSIIPKEFSEFQIFVRTLTGDTISDDVIEEAWRHIYRNETPEERSCNLSTIVTSPTPSDIVSETRNDVNVVSKIYLSSRENSKKKYSSQYIRTSKEKRVRVRKKIENLGPSVEMCTDSSSEKINENLPNTVQNDVHNSVSAPKPFDSVSKRVKKAQCSSSSTCKKTGKVKISIPENEIGDNLNKSDADFNDLTSNSKKVIYNKTLQDDYDSNISPVQQVELSPKKKKKKRSLSSRAAVSSKQILETYPKTKSDDVSSDKDEDSSIDCEIIKIVSSNNINYKASNDSENELNTSMIKSEESDSDSSVEILELQCNINQSIFNDNKDTHCPIHGEKDYQVPTNSCESFVNRKKSNFVDPQIPQNHKMCSNSSDNDLKQKVERKKRKNDKYKVLKSEVKCLKSLLVNLLISLQNTSGNRCMGSENIPSVLTPDLSDTVKENGVKNEKRSGSCFGGRRKMTEEYESKAGLSPNLKSSDFMEGESARKNYKSHERKRANSKKAKTYDDVPELFEKFNDADSSTSDNGKRQKFIWREIIADTLKSRPGRQMPVEKLKRIVIAKYYLCRGNVSQNTTVKFFRYLHSTAGVVINGDMAVYSNNEYKLSSISEQKKQFVLKTVTTTKEYKMS